MRTPGTLRSSTEFNRVLQRGRRAEARGVVVYALPARVSGEEGAGEAPARIGLVVRAPNQAVVRNRIKRRVRAAFIACGPAPGYDIVVRADERAASMSFTDLTDALSKTLAICGVPAGGPGSLR